MGINLTLRPGRWPFCSERWTIGALLDDGAVLLLGLGGIRTLGTHWGRISAELYRPGLPVIEGHTPVRVIRGGGNVLQCGPARIDHNRLYFTTPGLSGQLTFSPRYPAARLEETILKDGDRALQWGVEIPDADVRGQLQWPGGALSVSGRGFRDRIYSDLLPWRAHFHAVRWGRTVTPNHAAIWMEGRAPEGTTRVTWCDGATADSSPPQVAPKSVRPLSGTAEVDPEAEAERLGHLRPLIARLSGKAVEHRQTGTADLHGETGVALLGSVHWESPSF